MGTVGSKKGKKQNNEKQEAVKANNNTHHTTSKPVKPSATSPTSASTKTSPNNVDDEDEEDDLDSEASFMDMLKGPRIVLPKPCSVCAAQMKEIRWRDWDTNADYCQACAINQKASYAGNLIGADAVDSLYPARGGVMRDTLHEAFQRFGSRPCLAVHQRFLPKHAPCDFPLCRSPYRWFSYQTIYDRAREFAAGLIPLVKAGTFVGICGPNRIDWIIADIACIFAGIVSVPLHVTLSDEETTSIVAQTELSVVISQANLVGRFSSKSCPSLQHIIVFDELNKPVEIKHDISTHSMSSVMESGKKSLSSLPPKQYMVAVPPHSPDSMVTILFTSGSTGSGKGVMIPDRAWNQRMSSLYFYSVPWVELCFQPLAHFNGRFQVLETICRGGLIAMFRSSASDADYSASSGSSSSNGSSEGMASMQQLFDDFNVIRPTQISSVPRMWNVLFHQFHKLLFVALTANKQLSNPKPDEEVEEDVILPFRTMFGNRLANIGSGSAAISPNVIEWMRRVWNRTGVSDAYGSTEAGGISNDFRASHQVEIKLRDVPDLGYSATDRPARGEIIVRTRTRALGYWKQPEATAEAFLPNGWFATGDVGELQPDGRITIIDRCKNIFKLSQGEYVCPEKIEQALLSSRLVSQIFVHGDSRASFVVAVVVPSPIAIAEVLPSLPSSSATSTTSSETKTAPSPSSSLLPDTLTPAQHEALVALILDDLQLVGNTAKLLAYEIPRSVLISLQPFSAANRLLTANLKPSRSALTKHYRTSLLALYGLPEPEVAPPSSPLSSSSSSTSSSSGSGDLLRAVSEILGVGGLKKNAALKQQASIDSFSAVRISNRFEQLFKIKVPIATLLAENTTVDDIERLLSASSSTSSSSSSSSSAAPTSSSSTSLDLTAEIHPTRVQKVLGSTPKSDTKWLPTMNDSITHALWLVTGATGFLGAHIVADIMERTPATTRVAILTRSTVSSSLSSSSLSPPPTDEKKSSGDVDGEARAKCMSRFIDTMKQQQRWQASFADRIQVVIGDMSEVRLGLCDSDYEYLANNITAVIHNAAHVNHALPFQHLKPANVDSVLHIIALTTCKQRRIPVSYVSTASTMASSGRALSEGQVRLSNGYTQSKWVAERLLEYIHQHHYHPCISIYRPGAITGHSNTGACNPGDFINRVILSSIQLGRAAPMRTRVSMVPVDFVSSSIVLLTLHPPPSTPATAAVASYTLLLPSRLLWVDIVDAIRSAGYTCEPVALWSQWLRLLDANSQYKPAAATVGGVGVAGAATETRANSLMEFRSTLNAGPPNLNSWICDATLTALSTAGVSLPIIDASLVHRYMRYYETCHLLPSRTSASGGIV